MPFFLGLVPQIHWLYGNLDYSLNKTHRHYQAHDDWYPDRKAKTLGHKQGSMCQPNLKTSKYMTLAPSMIPRGCQREIKKYQICEAGAKNKEECLNDKISIMEVCPDFILEELREKKKWYLRAESIDNETYKRAMQVSDYNRGRSVSDIDLANRPTNLHPGSMWADDRYNPTKHSHPHRYDNINFPEQEYKDFFGGTLGDAEKAERERHRLDLSGRSQAMNDHDKARRMEKLKARDVVNQVNDLNKSE